MTTVTLLVSGSTTTTNTSAQTIPFNPSLTASSGFLVVICAAENTGTSGATALTSFTDSVAGRSAGTTFEQQTWAAGNTTPGAGVTAAFYVKTINAGNNGNGTITIASASARKAWHVYYVTGFPSATAGFGGAGTKFGTGANSSTPSRQSSYNNVGNGAVTFGFLAVESNVAPTADSDSSNGYWCGDASGAAGGQTFSGVGSGTTANGLASQWKIGTYTGSTTPTPALIYNPVLASTLDHQVGLIELIPLVANPAMAAPTVVAMGLTTASLSWVAPWATYGITDYVVEYRTAAGPGAWVTFADGVGTATSTVVTGLTPSTNYQFNIKSTNALALTSATGAIASGTTSTNAGYLLGYNGGTGTIPTVGTTAIWDMSLDYQATGTIVQFMAGSTAASGTLVVAPTDPVFYAPPYDINTGISTFTGWSANISSIGSSGSVALSAQTTADANFAGTVTKPGEWIGYWGIYGSNPGISPDSVRFTGGTTSIVGSYVYHVFTSSGTLGWISGSPVTDVELQICGGGGTGGSGSNGKASYGGGGGGAGGWQAVTGLTLTSSQTIVVGGAGSASSVGGTYVAEGGKTGGNASTAKAGTSGQFGSGAGAATDFTGTTAGGATTGGGYKGGNGLYNGSAGGAGAGAGHGGAGADATASNNPLPATVGATRWLGIETGYGGGCGNGLTGAQQISSTYTNSAYGSGGCGGALVVVAGTAGKAGVVIVRYPA